MFGCNPSCAPAAPLAASWHRRRQIFQPLPEKEYFYPSWILFMTPALAGGGSWGGQELGWDLSFSEEQSQGEMLEVNPVISAGAEAGKAKIAPQNEVPHWGDTPEPLLDGFSKGLSQKALSRQGLASQIHSGYLHPIPKTPRNTPWLHRARFDGLEALPTWINPGRGSQSCRFGARSGREQRR